MFGLIINLLLLLALIPEVFSDVTDPLGEWSNLVLMSEVMLIVSCVECNVQTKSMKIWAESTGLGQQLENIFKKYLSFAQKLTIFF